MIGTVCEDQTGRMCTHLSITVL